MMHCKYLRGVIESRLVLLVRPTQTAVFVLPNPRVQRDKFGDDLFDSRPRFLRGADGQVKTWALNTACKYLRGIIAERLIFALQVLAARSQGKIHGYRPTRSLQVLAETSGLAK